MKAKKKYLAVFPLCLGLSLLWHLIGALGIGTTPEPRSGFAQPVVPTLLLARPLEFLDVGADYLGKPVRRPVASETDPEYFGFYSPDLEGFSGIGHSVEDCIYKAKWGIKEHMNLLKEQGLPIPPINPYPKIIIQNEDKMVAA